MSTYKTEGIILKKTKFGEADQIVTFFSKHYGKVKALAKGIRRLTSKKTGSLELGNWTILFLAQGKNLDLITEVELKKTFSVLKNDLDKSVAVFHVLELTERLTAERQVSLPVHDLLRKTLEIMESWQNNWGKIDLLLASFSIKLLTTLGFWEDEEVGNLFSLTEKDSKRLSLLRTIKLEEIAKIETNLSTQEKIKEIVDNYTTTILESQIRSQGLMQKIRKLE